MVVVANATDAAVVADAFESVVGALVAIRASTAFTIRLLQISTDAHYEIFKSRSLAMTGERKHATC